MSTTSTFRSLAALCLSAVLLLGPAWSRTEDAAATDDSEKAIPAGLAEYVLQVSPDPNKDRQQALPRKALKKTRKILREVLKAGKLKGVRLSDDGKNRISILFPPTVKPGDAANLIEILVQPHDLEFRIVDPKETAAAQMRENYKAPLGKIILEIAPDQNDKRLGQDMEAEKIVVSAPELSDPEFSGNFLKSAFASKQPEGWVIFLTFDEKGGEIMGALTQANVGNRMAILLGGEAISAPTIQGSFTKECRISGNFDRTSAGTLAALLDNPLPFSLKIIKSPSNDKKPAPLPGANGEIE